MNKKIIALMLMLSMLVLGACGAKGTEATDAPDGTKVLKVGDTWEVDGEWKLKVESVKYTKDRNKYTDKKPKEVFVVEYTYENIGHDEPLYVTPKEVLNEKGEKLETYPIIPDTAPSEISKGKKAEKVQEGYGIEEGKDVKVNFEIPGKDGLVKKASFEATVK